MKQKIYFKQEVLVIFQIIKDKIYYENDDTSINRLDT
jgi:hypothetical protein